MLKLCDYLHEKLVFLNVDVESDEAIIKYLSKKLEEQGFVKDSFCEALLEREGYAPTGLPIEPVGVAIPHAEPQHVIKPCIAIATLLNPVSFVEMGTDSNRIDVKVVFCLALNDAGNHLEALQQIISYVTDGEMLVEIVGASSIQKLFSILSREV